jgi:hypothetical protein
LEENEVEVGFRPYGSTDLFSKTKNYNYSLERDINE